MIVFGVIIIMNKKQNKTNTKPNSDKKKVQQILRGFDQDRSEAVSYLKQKYGDLKQYEILQIAEYCTSKIKILALDRESKRRKEVLLKWFDENFSILKPVLDDIVVENEEHNFFGAKADMFKSKNSENDMDDGIYYQDDTVKEEIISQDNTLKEEVASQNIVAKQDIISSDNNLFKIEFK